MSEAAIKIFYSYARKDRELRDALDKHLAPLRAAGKIETWHDLQLDAGSEWERDLLARLEAADIILLLISSDFMDSPYCYSKEMGVAIDRHNAGEAKVIPIILRSCDWNQPDVPFRKLTVLPTDAKPVVGWSEHDDAYTIVAQKIRETVEQIGVKRQKGILAMAQAQREAQQRAVEKAEQEKQAAAQLAEQIRQKELDQKLEREQGQLFSFTSVRVNAQGQVIPQGERQARCRTFEIGRNVDLEMVYVPAGSFSMGSNESKSEQPIHRVTLSAFHLGKYPVTQAQYQAVMGKNPSEFQGDDRYPVEQVSWLDAIAFCEKLSAQTGYIFTLPSEAQWEYACRAGTDMAFAYGKTINKDLANHSRSVGKVTIVGKYPPNGWGLCDMHGNVWEWCLDDWHSSYKNAPIDGSAWIEEDNKNTRKLLRGGSWNLNPHYCRSACRVNGNPDYHYNGIGFRVRCLAARTS